MNQGGKATLILPYEIAYGISDPRTSIPPFTPLLFEVEVVSAKKIKK
jgi:FKBP-type peptidyl-prolyl cis-trans isomerase